MLTCGGPWGWLTENHLRSRLHIISALWNDILVVFLTQVTYIFLANINYNEFHIQLTELLQFQRWCSSYNLASHQFMFIAF